MMTTASTERTCCLLSGCLLSGSLLHSYCERAPVRWWAARDARRGCVRARRVQAKGMVQGEGWGGEAKVEWGSVQDEKGGGGVLGSAGRACILRSCAFACVVGQWPDWRRGGKRKRDGEHSPWAGARIMNGRERAHRASSPHTDEIRCGVPVDEARHICVCACVCRICRRPYRAQQRTHIRNRVLSADLWEAGPEPWCLVCRC